MDSIIALFEVYLRIIIIDFLRYFIPAGLAFILCWKLFRNQLQHRFIQIKWPSSKKIWNEFKYSMSTIIIFALVGLSIVTAEKQGLTRIYYEVADFGWFYLLFSFIVMVLFHDMYFYWTHRWMHHPKIYRHVHKVHHLSTNPSPWAAYSFHPLEAIVQALVFPIILFSMPVHTSIAFTFLIYMIVRNVWGHLGFELFPKKFMNLKWLNWHTTTTHHNIHHESFRSNYGLYFTWWDRWFQTEDKQYKDRFNEVTGRKSQNINKKWSSLILLLVLSPLLSNAQSPAGKWITYDESTGDPLSVIGIYHDKSSNTWEGKVDSVILKPGEGINPTCINCPDKFNNKPVIGMRFLWGFEKSGEYWVDGKILDPEGGSIYNGKIWFIKAGQLKVRGFGGPLGMFYRTQIWQQIEGTGIEGLWQTIDDRYNQVKSLVQLKVENGELMGTIQEIYLLCHEGNYPVCVECKNDLKNQPIVGMQIMRGFTNTAGKWDNGTILDPGNGTTYIARFWLVDADILRIRGYWGPFYRTQEWKRL